MGLAVALAGCAAVPVDVDVDVAAVGGDAARELAVPDVRQSTGYTCGAAALMAILAYYGVESREDRLAGELGATPEKGVSPPSILRVAEGYGLRGHLQQNMTIEALSGAVAAGSPVLVALQAWPAEARASFRDVWDEGHYLIVVAVEGDALVFEDPSLLGSRGVLRADEFLERWHDTDGENRYWRMGIVFGGRAPAPPSPRQKIE